MQVLFCKYWQLSSSRLIASETELIDMFDEIFAAFRSDYLSIPGEPDKKFLYQKKEQHLKDDYYSYSGYFDG